MARGIGAGIAAGLAVDGWDLALSFWSRTTIGNQSWPCPYGWMDDQTRASGIAMQPSGRLGTPTDVANLVRFLLSDQGQLVNGQLLYSNGGPPKGHLPR